jgi:hypothetical protein
VTHNDNFTTKTDERTVEKDLKDKSTIRKEQNEKKRGKEKG